MRNRLLLIFLFINFSPAFSQDMLVLKKDEREITCKIVLINDSIVRYRLWKSDDKNLYTVRKHEVLSFLMDRSLKRSGEFSKDEDANRDKGLLGEYQSGSVVPGYVITNNEDTLQGFISVKNVAMNQLVVNFTDNDGRAVVYSTGDLKGYGYAQIHYEKIYTGFKKRITNNYKSVDGYQFLHRGVDGPSRMYRFYTLRFNQSLVISYNNDPPTYLGKLKRHFVITNPAGARIFTRRKTLKGSVNRIYFKYPQYLLEHPVGTPTTWELPGIVKNFNYWYEKKN